LEIKRDPKTESMIKKHKESKKRVSPVGSVISLLILNIIKINIIEKKMDTAKLILPL